MFDTQLWVSPLAGENPSGEGLRNDPRFHEIERMMQPQVEVTRDDRNNPVSQVAVPVDWAAILDRAEALRERGRDLRLLVIVTRALANQSGFSGLATGLDLIARTFQQHWETMHPELKPGAPPREAALRRINALLQLQNAQDGVLRDLRDMPFFAPRGIGPISGLDLERGTLDLRTHLNEVGPGMSEAEKSAEAGRHEQMINRVRTGCAAYADQSAAEMAALIEAARTAATALRSLEQALAEKLGSEVDVKLVDLGQFLTRSLATLERAVNAATGTAAPRRGGNGAADMNQASPSGTGPGPSRNGEYEGTLEYVSFPERLSDRDDVVKCLDLIIAFYDRTEPSSPIPHLARRVRRMVHMDFLELMEDLAPSGLKEFRLLAGVPDGKKSAQKDER